MKTLSVQFIALGLMSVMGVQAWGSQEKFSKGAQNFERVKRLLLNNYYDSSITEDQLYRAAVRGMLQELNHEGRSFNSLLFPVEWNELSTSMQGEFVGIGVAMGFDLSSGRAFVNQVIPNSPADKADLQVGDQILKINGKSVRKQSLPQLAQKIRGRVGEPCTVKVLREDDVFEKLIVREHIVWNSVEEEFIPQGKLGRLRLKNFDQRTPELMKTALQNFKQQKINKLIIDLRNNSGGLFEKAVLSADLLVPKGMVIGHVLTRQKDVQKIEAKQEPIIAKVPIVVIVNRKTSSGAELFAASLRDNNLAQLVGEPTFGKWSVENVEKLPNDFAVKYTVKVFRNPKNQDQQQRGLRPDIVVTPHPRLNLKKGGNLNFRLGSTDPAWKTAVQLVNYPLLTP